MGSINISLGWEEQKLPENPKYIGVQEMHYYMRRMKRGQACWKDYAAHIILCFFETETELRNGWDKLNNYVAVGLQRKVESLIEKSNFYICCFVKGSVGMDLCHEIEGDSFCAKKYLFKTASWDVKAACCEIEERIFDLTIEKRGLTGAKMKAIQLKNFRAYEGEVTVNFQYREKQSASFVAIYAPNGIGKTSLLDGVEYALKGEVSRLKDLKSKAEGAVYHNRNHLKEEAHVKIELDTGIEIYRKVRNVPGEGNDIYRNPPIRGKELVGEPKQWSQTLLPHHLIDSFITAKNPQQQYKEWVESTQIFDAERKEFVDAHKKIKAVEGSLEKLEEELKKKEQEKERLEKDKEAAQELNRLIVQYNALSPEEELKAPKGENSIGQYFALLNRVQMIQGKLAEKELPRIESKIEIARDILETGVVEYQKKMSLWQETGQKIKIAERKIEERYAYEKLFVENEHNSREISSLKTELISLKKIEDCGMEWVLEAVQEYDRAEEEIAVSGSLLQQFKEQRDKAKEQSREVKVELERLMQEQNNEARWKFVKEYDQQKKNMDRKIRDIDEMIKIHQARLNELRNQNEKIQEKIDWLADITLSRDINGYEKDESWTCMLSGAVIERLSALKKDYLCEKQNIEECQVRLQKAINNKKELEELKNAGIRYLQRNQEVCICPLCSTPFPNWEKLLGKINDVQTEEDAMLNAYMAEVLCKIHNYEEEYSILRQQCLEVRNKKVRKLQVQKEKQIENQIGIEKELGRYDEMRYELNQEIVFQDEKLQAYGIPIEETFSKGILQWSMDRQEWLKGEMAGKVIHLNALEVEIEKLCQLEAREIKKQQKSQKKIEVLMEDSDLYGCVRYVINHRQTDLVQKKRELEIKIEKLLAQQNENQQRLAQYQEVSHMELSGLQAEKKRLEQLYAQNQGIQEKCAIFEEFTSEGVESTLTGWEKSKRYMEERLLLLEQIQAEHAAQYYYQRYRDCVKEIESYKKKKGQEKEKADEWNKRFKRTKKVLEEKMRIYFNQKSINEIFRKIDPHDVMKRVDYQLDFNEKEEPQLFIQVKDDKGQGAYRPEWYFSTAQLNTVAFSSFFGRALTAENLSLSTIFVDDPIGHFDDMNILGFADLMRSVLEVNDCQIILTTHDEKVFRILERKLNPEYYSAKFITLPRSDAVSVNKIG